MAEPYWQEHAHSGDREASNVSLLVDEPGRGSDSVAGQFTAEANLQHTTSTSRSQSKQGTIKYSSIKDENDQSAEKPPPWWTRAMKRLATVAFPLIKKEEREGEEWVQGVLLCSIGVAAVLLLNLVLLLVAVGLAYSDHRESSSRTRDFVSAAVFEGTCSVVNNWSTGLHLLINILSTALLAASNFVMQCLTAPSRADLDHAHSRRKWLHVGVWGWRNLFAMDAKRLTLWFLLLISSTPIHLFYNSAVFYSFSTQQYGKVVIPSYLSESDTLILDGDEASDRVLTSWVGYGTADLHAEIFNGTLKTMSVKDCVKRYAVDYNTEGSTVVLVTTKDDALPPRTASMAASMHLGSETGYNWMCETTGKCKPSDIMWNADQGTWSVTGSYWSYPKWNFTAPGYDGNPVEWNFNSLTEFQDPFDGENYYDDYGNDIRYLYWLIVLNNPDEMDLSLAITQPDMSWSNFSWAEEVQFQAGEPNGRNILSITDNLDIGSAGAWKLPVSHCLSKDATQRCELLFSLPIGIIVLLCNCVKLVCMYLAARLIDRKNVLLTVGDAVASFLTSPDPVTKGRCSMSRSDVTSSKKIWTSAPTASIVDGNGYEIPMHNLPAPGRQDSRATYPRSLPRRKFWLRATSFGSWFLLAVVIGLCIGAGVGLYYYGGWQIGQVTPAFQEAWNLGFGKINPSTLVHGVGFPKDILSLVLLINAPQIVLTIVYFLCNGIFTCMLVASEYNDYSISRKPLRVSWPKGKQRSTYYLSLPYRYSLPFMGMSTLLHWLVSQSWFLVKIRSFDVHGHFYSGDSVTTCCYSLAAIFLTLVIGGSAITTLLGISLKRFKSGMPLASSCSAAISAACHPLEWDRDAALKPVMWGEVTSLREDSESSSSNVEGDESERHWETGTEYPHCTFSSGDVTTPDKNTQYC